MDAIVKVEYGDKPYDGAKANQTQLNKLQVASFRGDRGLPLLSPLRRRTYRFLYTLRIADKEIIVSSLEEKEISFLHFKDKSSFSLLQGGGNLLLLLEQEMSRRSPAPSSSRLATSLAPHTPPVRTMASARARSTRGPSTHIVRGWSLTPPMAVRPPTATPHGTRHAACPS